MSFNARYKRHSASTRQLFERPADAPEHRHVEQCRSGHRDPGQGSRRGQVRGHRAQRRIEREQRRRELPAHRHGQREVAAQEIPPARAAVAGMEPGQAQQRDAEGEPGVGRPRRRDLHGRRDGDERELQPVEGHHGQEVAEHGGFGQLIAPQPRRDEARVPEKAVVEGHELRFRPPYSPPESPSSPP